MPIPLLTKTQEVTPNGACENTEIPAAAVNSKIRSGALDAEVVLAGSGAPQIESEREHLVDEVFKQMSNTDYVKSGMVRVVRVTTSTNLLPEPIARLCEFKDGWDGRSAAQPSETLLLHAKDAWREVDRILPPDFLRPKVRMGRANFVSLSWTQKEPRKELHIWIHDSADFSAEFHFRSAELQQDGPIQDTNGLMQAVKLFFEF